MAHQIENNMIAYKNDTPWHGLGFRVEATATGAEMLKTAGMDWKVQRRSLAMRGDLTNASTDRTAMLTEELKDFKAIVRSDNNSVFCIPTAKYQVVQNEEIVDTFREYCEAGHASMETVGAIRNGAVVWALAKLNGGSEMTLRGGDLLKGYILMSTSHDGSLSTTAKATQVRVVCHNTLTAALRGKADFRMKHTAKFTDARKQEVRESMGIAMEQIKRINVVSEKLSNVAIDQQGRVEFIYRLMGGESILDQAIANTGASNLDKAVQATGVKKISEHQLNFVGKQVLEAMLTSPGASLESAKDTFWGAVNGVTYYADHQRGRTQDTRLASSWFGNSDQLKTQAVNLALDMAGVTV